MLIQSKPTGFDRVVVKPGTTNEVVVTHFYALS